MTIPETLSNRITFITGDSSIVPSIFKRITSTIVIFRATILSFPRIFKVRRAKRGLH